MMNEYCVKEITEKHITCGEVPKPTSFNIHISSSFKVFCKGTLNLKYVKLTSAWSVYTNGTNSFEAHYFINETTHNSEVKMG